MEPKPPVNQIPATEVNASNTQTTKYFIYFLFGVLDVLLIFRFILKLTGANPGSLFVSLIYTLTSIFVLPFQGIFRQGFSEGNVTTSIFEPSTLIALIVYTLIAWGIVKLVIILAGKKNI
jgi:hypothetical protein